MLTAGHSAAGSVVMRSRSHLAGSGDGEDMTLPGRIAVGPPVAPAERAGLHAAHGALSGPSVRAGVPDSRSPDSRTARGGVQVSSRPARRGPITRETARPPGGAWNLHHGPPGRGDAAAARR